MKTFQQFQEKLSDKEYKEVGALLNRDTLLRGNLIKNPTQRQKFATMSGRETFRRLKRNEDGKLRIDRGTEEKIKVNKHTVSKNFPELSKKPAEKYKKVYRLPYIPEGVAALAVGGSKLIPALMTGIGAAGTIMQAQRGRPKGEPSKRYKRNKPKRKISDMERKLTDRLDKQSVNTKRVGKAFDATGLDLNKKSKLITPKNGQVIQDEFSAPTNSTGPAVPGTGDDSSTVVVKKKKPPMLKRKTYAKGGIKSRKPWLDYLKNK